ncbi:MAG: nucleoside-diphosphate-sugar epimerase [Solirubrobacteraceae bacterium]|nr:nucleoside-diphosphate-sugar epimerase [Solirubrobacteraceae bacterium]
MPDQLVLVTGGSGFIGAHCIRRLHDDGYRVRTTVRSLAREPEVREMAGPGPLEVVTADLTADAGWAEAVAGCAYVLHVASPFPIAQPKHEDELIVPARDGAVRVLRAAQQAGVRRVVLTSSFAAIGYGHAHGHDDPIYDETSWTDVDGPGVSAYAKSKTLAERAAWAFVEQQGEQLELAVVNPVAVLGPLLGPDASTSIELVKRLIDGSMPGTPNVAYGLVDVRDVADLHLRAMTAPEAAGERFLAMGDEFRWLSEMGEWLREALPERAKKIPRRGLPGPLVRLASLFDRDLRQLVPELGVRKRATNEKARRVLGWAPRSDRDAVVATAESLLALGLVE